MLCISRKATESFVLKDSDGNIIANIVILDCGAGRARIGIEADRSVRILRTELEDRDKPKAA
jgi:sRNA-binding carbon storage regulator CsrA